MHEKAPSDKPKISAEDHPFILSDTKLRRLVSWFAVGGISVLSACTFGFMGYEAIFGRPSPENWFLRLVEMHYAALLGGPAAAATAFYVVTLLKVTSGPIEFEALGVKFHGASGPIVLWIFCFGAVVAAIYLCMGKDCLTLVARLQSSALGHRPHPDEAAPLAARARVIRAKERLKLVGIGV
jgi:hypothetical protein